jgi:uncharacterized protein (TIGR04255 family)
MKREAMSISPPYPAPPIIDSIIEFRLKNPLSQREQALIVKSLRSGYDKDDDASEVEVQVRIEHGKIESTTGPPKLVHVLSNLDQTDFCRVEVSKLHWSRLPPYEGWLAFQSRVIRDLDKLPKKVGLPTLERIGVRFRNRIDVPAGENDICRYEDYLLVNIGLPPLLDPHDGYQWKIEKLFRDRGIGATIHSGIMPSELPKTLAVLLDIDVYVLADLPNRRDDLMEKLEEIHVLKNEIFEACVTPKARDSFQ